MQNLEKDFIEMVNSHRGIIFKVCRLYVDHAEDRNDLFQEIIIQLWRSFPGFRGESKISTWMYRVALNTAISHFRSKTKRPDQRSLSISEFQIADVNDSIEVNESINILSDAIQQLSRIDRAVILLYLEEKNYEEIGEIMGITQTNVGVKINRIKIRLEKIIKRIDI